MQWAITEKCLLFWTILQIFRKFDIEKYQTDRERVILLKKNTLVWLLCSVYDGVPSYSFSTHFRSSVLTTERLASSQFSLVSWKITIFSAHLLHRWSYFFWVQFDSVWLHYSFHCKIDFLFRFSQFVAAPQSLQYRFSVHFFKFCGCTTAVTCGVDFLPCFGCTTAVTAELIFCWVFTFWGCTYYSCDML